MHKSVLSLLMSLSLATPTAFAKNSGSSAPAAPAPVHQAAPAPVHRPDPAPAPRAPAPAPVVHAPAPAPAPVAKPAAQEVKPAAHEAKPATAPATPVKAATEAPKAKAPGVGRDGKPAAEHQQVAPAALNRANKSGVNSQPPMAGKVTDIGSGRTKVIEHDASGKPTGRVSVMRKDGTVSSMTKKDGTKVAYDANGKAKAIKSPDGKEVRIHKDNSKSLVKPGPNGTKLVTKLDSKGQVRSHETVRQVGGTTIKTRTTIINNRTVVTNYHTYSYGGSHYYGYHPYYGFAAAFYTGYLFGAMWSTPYVYGWNSYATLGWYTPYSYYYSPWPRYGVYPYLGSQYWLTDYLLLQSIQSYHNQRLANEQAAAAAAQQQQQATNYVAAAPAQQQQQAEAGGQLDEATKLEIAAQIKEQIAAQQKQESVPLAATLTRPNYNYIVGDEEIEASYEDGKACELSKGDILVLAEKHTEGDKVASMRVKTAKKSSCKAGATVEVSLEDIQEMQNSVAHMIDQGQNQISKSAGKDGLPAAPAGVSLASKPTIAEDPSAVSEAQKAAEAAKAEASSIQAAAETNDAPKE